MSIEAVERAHVTPLLAEDRWKGRIYLGEWVDAPVTIDVTEPATGAVLGVAGSADPATVARAAASAVRAQPDWAATAFTERAAVLRRAAGLLQRHHEELARWIVRETGGVAAKADVELQASAGELLEAAALTSQPDGLTLPSAQPGRHSLARRIPVGVVGVIAPWNFPLTLALRSVAPALALGNAVVLKSDPNTPLVGGVLVARVLEEAGLPAGVLHAFTGGVDVGQALVADPNVHMISFTGSTAAGRAVGAAAGRLLKRVALELGGNNALIVLADADVEAASSAGAWGSFLHQGQICMAAGRHIVHESIAADYLDALTERAGRLLAGNPDTGKVALGPLISEKQIARVQQIVDDSVAAGAALRIGGHRDGPFFPATVVSDVGSAMPVYQEEVFGPVAPVITFRDADEAVALANLGEHGLAAAIQSADPERALEIGRRIRAGMVHINDQTVNDDPHAPFGGLGASGNGVSFGSVANWDSFSKWQWVTSRNKATPFPF
ncbi:benzaldehyde dehydrogenase [Frankia sp. QA3]|uniref:benzaldehyde dehydrogenase n=1 Tax=Frankia sp. QA3 TaxID=710111 RepID=UPI000269BF8C|nr:benzaldehyde dehydrogenase [Frankia sp. QA3]EIV92877.1 NAD-dependent aldehyde dehydrogenase [Frankia sp. QA3]